MSDDVETLTGLTRAVRRFEAAAAAASVDHGHTPQFLDTLSGIVDLHRRTVMLLGRREPVGPRAVPSLAREAYDLRLHGVTAHAARGAFAIALRSDRKVDVDGRRLSVADYAVEYIAAVSGATAVLRALLS